MVEPKTIIQNDDPIDFYGSSQPFYEFSNFFPSKFQLDSKEWKTSEHYFQAQKGLTEEVQEKIRNLKTPRESKIIANELPLRSDWNEVKIGIMEKCCLAKFKQNEDLKKILLSTGDRQLREHTSNDYFWGDGGDGSGQNHLGKILMRVREILKEQK